MIGYITLGVDDIALARRFYSAFLPRLGYAMEVSPEGLGFLIPETEAPENTHPKLYIRTPYDGQTASAGNGAMVAFQVETQALVRELHAAALGAGGRDEGVPGFRADYGPHFFVGYLRDPQGNKIALYCDNPNEPARPD